MRACSSRARGLSACECGRRDLSSMGKRDAMRTNLHWALLNHWTLPHASNRRLGILLCKRSKSLPTMKIEVACCALRAGCNLGSPHTADRSPYLELPFPSVPSDKQRRGTTITRDAACKLKTFLDAALEVGYSPCGATETRCRHGAVTPVAVLHVT
jgi:hypothetical protein